MKQWSLELGVGLSCLLTACAVVDFGVGGSGGAGAGSPSGGSESVTAGGFGGALNGGSGAGTSTTMTGLGGETTSTGGAPPVLVDSGLVVRYYLDEAASGSPDGAMAVDAAPSPLNLPITWEMGDQFRYAEIDGQRGLESTQVGRNGRASLVDITPSKLHAELDGSTTATLEIVAEVSAVHPDNSRFIHFGSDDEAGRFTLAANATGSVTFYWRSASVFPFDYLAGHWGMNFIPGERVVVHLVLDSNAMAVDDRARLYRNGVLITGNDTENPVQPGQAISFGDNDSFVLGNREIGGRSFDGTLFYAAVYSAALTAADVVNNTEVLLANDDTPE